MKSTQSTSAKALLTKITSGAKVAPKKSDNRANRPEFELNESLSETFKRFAGAFALSEVIEARLEQEKGSLSEGVFEIWVEKLWKTKSPPPNPYITADKDGVPDVQSIFQVQERFCLDLPEVPEDKELEQVLIEKFTELFVATDMDQADAEASAFRFVNNELDLNPKTTIDLSKLVFGHYEGEGKNRTFVEASENEQALAAKVLGLLGCRTKEELMEMEPITEEESKQLIEQKLNVTVKKGFLQRVCTYVHSIDQLKAIFLVIKPVKFPSKTKFGVNDTPEAKNTRLLDEAKSILGVKKK
jgi:hypothetical protein